MAELRARFLKDTEKAPMLDFSDASHEFYQTPLFSSQSFSDKMPIRVKELTAAGVSGTTSFYLRSLPLSIWAFLSHCNRNSLVLIPAQLAAPNELKCHDTNF